MQRYRHLFDEMTLWFLPVGTHFDKIVIACRVPQDYADYYGSFGLELPSAVTAGDDCADMQGVAWGWNDESVQMFKHYGATLAYPPTAVVARVNSREFAAQIGRELGYGVDDSRMCYSAEEVLAAAGDFNDRPLVVKPCYGNAGIGFVRLKPGGVGAQEKNRICRLFEQGAACVSVEPWLERQLDVSTRFTVEQNGVVSELFHHPTLITAAGGFYGLMLEVDGMSVLPWQTELDAMARHAAERLYLEGYWGPVTIDSMVVRDSRQQARLVCLIDINARQSMSLIAYSLRERLAPGRHCLMRTIGKKQHRLPEDYPQWRERIGSLCYDPQTRAGVVCVTPLWYEKGGQKMRPYRSIFFIAGESKEQLQKMDKQLTNLIKR
ncbi:MAG: hypothetical protein GY868_21505 [Deltaproteobacteria bacterium]|nr:hypothetical protein [Deltaproteobacteria bacterium]